MKLTEAEAAAVERVREAAMAVEHATHSDKMFHFEISWGYQESETIPAKDVITVLTALDRAVSRTCEWTVTDAHAYGTVYRASCKPDTDLQDVEFDDGDEPATVFPKFCPNCGGRVAIQEAE